MGDARVALRAANAVAIAIRVVRDYTLVYRAGASALG
jgi:hypothetical protein